MHLASPLPSLGDARTRSFVGAAALLLFTSACMPNEVPETTTMLTDPDPMTTTTDDGPTTLGTTTSTVTTDPVMSTSSTASTDSSSTDSSTTTTGDSDSTTSSSSTGDAPCNHDQICDDDEDIVGCLSDCAGCEPDETCDAGTETPFACPSDCAPTGCDHNATVDPLTEQCDDGNQENADICTNACKLNICGDGYLYGAGKGGAEECDDANLEDLDGCSSKCIRERRLVFVSSQQYKGNLTPPVDQLVGLDLGDAHCQILASEADHPGVFRAWLSDETKSPATRFGIPPGFAGLYELPSGTVVAESWSDLTDGSLATAIAEDEHGKPVEPSAVWTNTSVAGNGMGSLHCQFWSSNNFDDKAPVGSTQAKTGAWTEADPITCSAPARLYCIQVE